MRVDFPIFPTRIKLLPGVFSCLVFAAVCFGQNAAPNAVPPLKPGVSVEGDFAAGEPQTFALHLESNQFAAIVLNQKGINAGIALDNYDGKRLLEVNVNEGGYGYERALFASGDTPRDILVRVFPAQKKRAADGKFSVILAELKAADEKDKLQIEIQTSVLKAAKLFTDTKTESKRQSVLLLDNLLKPARESGDPILEATVLRLLQTAFRTGGEPDKSIEFGKSALALLTGKENRYFRLTVNELIGSALVDVGEANRSIKILNECFVETEVFGDDSIKIKVLLDLSAAYKYLNDLTKSLEAANQALKISRSSGDQVSQIYTLSALGSIFTNRGDPLEVIKILNEALAIGEASGIKPADTYQNIYSNISTAYIDMGQLQKSLEYDQKALELTRQATGNKLDEADCLINLSKTYWRLGQNTRSMNYVQQAMQILSALNFKTASRTNLDLKGGIYLGLNEFEKAKDVYIEALKLAQTDVPPDLIRVKNSYYNLGFIEQNLGHLEIALDYYLKAARQAEEIKLQNSAVSYFKAAAVVYVLLGQSAKGEELAAKVLKMARDFGDRESESDALYTLARARRAQKDLPAALKLTEDALKIVESTRAELISQDNRTGYLSMVHDKYDFYISLLIEMQNQSKNEQFGAAAFAVNERARARGLLDLLAESYTDVSAGISPELKERERAGNAKISTLQTQSIRLKSAEKRDDKRIGELQKDIEKADEERKKIESEIRLANPRYATLKYPTTLNLAQTQAMLDEQTVLLEYQTGEDASYLFAVGKNEFQIVKLPDEKTLRGNLEILHKSISTPTRTGLANYLVTGRELYKTLLAPVENLLKTKKKIIVAADGALHYLPFEALLRNNMQTSLDKLPYLVRDFEISYTPSASVLANLKSYDKTAKPTKSFLAFAAPDYGTKTPEDNQLDTQNTRSAFGEKNIWSLTDLRFAKAEATRIAKLFPAGQSTVLTGAEATEEQVKAADFLTQYRYLHFAVHGLIDEDQPQFSSLVLSLPKPGEQSKTQILKSKIEEDGLLQTPEIFNLRLRADLVTLSACETGLGQEMRGEGIVGLTRAFFYAGTPSVLVSLWKVDDASTAELMTLFYENLLKGSGRDKAAALRESQLKLIVGNRYAHPYYWASFILQGKTNSDF